MILLIYYIVGVMVSAYVGWKRYNILMVHAVYFIIILCSAIYWPVLLNEYIYEQRT